MAKGYPVVYFIDDMYRLIYVLTHIILAGRPCVLFSRVGYVIVFVRDMNLMLNFWKKIGLNVRYSSDEWSDLELDNLILALTQRY